MKYGWSTPDYPTTNELIHPHQKELQRLSPQLFHWGNQNPHVLTSIEVHHDVCEAKHG